MRTNKIFSVSIWTLFTFLILGLLFHKEIEHYKDIQEFRLDPLELKSKNSLVYNQDAIWIVGDSRASQWNPEYFGPLKEKIINTGIEGQSSEQVLFRFKQDIELIKPEAVIIQVGINDLKNVKLLEDPKITLRCFQNTLEMINLCEINHVTVIYTSIFLPGRNPELLRRLFWSNSILDSIKTVNGLLKKYCDSEKILYIDCDSIFGANLNREEYYFDFLHLNEKGYEEITNHLLKEYRENLGIFAK